MCDNSYRKLFLIANNYHSIKASRVSKVSKVFKTIEPNEVEQLLVLILDEWE